MVDKTEWGDHRGENLERRAKKNKVNKFNSPEQDLVTANKKGNHINRF